MLDLGRYLLGVLEIALLVGFAWGGGAALRSRLLARVTGAPAYLATAVLALALLIWAAELLGSFGLFEPGPYLVLVIAVGLGTRTLLGRVAWGEGVEDDPARRPPPPMTGPARRGVHVPILIAFAIAALAVLKFALDIKPHLSTGMTGFDSTWYHGPFAAGYFQSGDTWSLHFIAPQFLAWFYPANGEIFHAVGMLAFGRDILSPLLNLGWFVGCLVACWCIGRPYRVAPWSLALGAIALSVPALADQAGEARNDIVGIFFLLAAVAVAVNAWAAREQEEKGLPPATLIVVGLAVGFAAGTKLNFLLPAAVLVVGLAVIAPRGARWGALAAAGLAALAGGGYWYLRNLVHSGSPLPWVDSLGPISLPAPEQALGGRDAHSVLSYLTDGAVWSNWFLPGLHDGLWLLWPLLAAAAFFGLVLALNPGGWSFRGSQSTNDVEKEPRNSAGGVDPPPVVGLVGLAAALAWLLAPTSASGPDGMPRGFESGLRYLAPALVLGLALLPTAPLLRNRLSASQKRRSSFFAHTAKKDERRRSAGRRGMAIVGSAGLVALLVAAGYPVQRHYLESRYSDPSFTTPGLDAAFAWSRDVTDSRIATTSTRQHPLFGTDLSNQVQFVGEEQPHGGFEAPTTCRAWRRELNAGDYDYVVTSRDRIEPNKPPYPPQASWTEGPAARPILRKPPAVVFQLTGNLDPSSCPS